MRLALPVIVLLAALTAGPAHAQEAAAVCPLIDPTLPPAFAGWTDKRPLKAAVKAAEASSARLTPGRAVIATLSVTSGVVFAKEPENQPPPASRSGIFELVIDQAGRYAFALDGAAWVDVIFGGAFLESADHGKAPACSTIRKEVEFDLKPGLHVIQISGTPRPEVGLLVTKVR